MVTIFLLWAVSIGALMVAFHRVVRGAAQRDREFMASMEPPAWVCPHCDKASWNPNDGEYRYCGACHHFCDDEDRRFEAMK